MPSLTALLPGRFRVESSKSGGSKTSQAAKAKPRLRSLVLERRLAGARRFPFLAEKALLQAQLQHPLLRGLRSA